MSNLTFAEQVALDYVDATECADMNRMRDNGATYREINMVTGRNHSTISRHTTGRCSHE